MRPRLISCSPVGYQIGDSVGDYEIVDVLGTGGMGRVYKVRHRISDRLEAMKVVLPDRRSDPQIAERFEREIKVHASLDHPNIARLHTALWVQDSLLMIIELVDGATLAERLRQGNLTIPEGLDCMRQVLDALAYAHSREVIHRDVKPANIMLTPAGQVKLMDFGIARQAGGGAITRSGLAVGSLLYMSPEQIKGLSVDARSDIYSAGVTLYETLTGKRPFRGNSDYAIMDAHLRQAPEPPTEFVPGFPEDVSRIILKSLAKDPAERFQTAEAFRAALATAAAQPQPAASYAGGTVTPSPSSSVFEPATLATIEKCLAAVLGPVARPLVARTARRVQTVPDLCRELCDQIPAENDRHSFLRCCEGQTTGVAAVRTVVPTGGVAAARPVTQTGAQTWSPEFLEKVKKELARHIGPLARILVDKTAKQAKSPAALIDLLANEIPDPRNRDAFITMARKLG